MSFCRFPPIYTSTLLHAVTRALAFIRVYTFIIPLFASLFFTRSSYTSTTRRCSRGTFLLFHRDKPPFSSPFSLLSPPTAEEKGTSPMTLIIPNSLFTHFLFFHVILLLRNRNRTLHLEKGWTAQSKSASIVYI